MSFIYMQEMQKKMKLFKLYPSAVILLEIFIVTNSLSLPNSISRRNVLGGTLGGASILAGGSKNVNAFQSGDLLADLPMIRLKLPKGGVGREYVSVKLMIQGQGPFEFMVDSGLTTELITPHLQQTLGIVSGRDKISGFAAGGETAQQSIVTLEGASLCCGNFAGANSELKLPNLRAIITDFPQEHVDPAHDIEGMLGQEMLSIYDCDLDFPNNRIRFWKPGTADTSGLVPIPAVVINETGLLGIRLGRVGAKQPILGFLDCGSTFSCVNWKAAEVIGLPPKSDPSYSKGPTIAAVGVDGRPLLLPSTEQQLTFAGEVEQDSTTGRPVGFAAPPAEWEPWKKILLTVGDIPAFSTILGDGGPAALIGLDILAQRRVVLEAGRGNSRLRRIFVSPK